jgi:hypothetical protein
MELTSELIDEICEKVMDGNFPLTAAVACGVATPQYNEWIRLGNTEINSISEGNKLNEKNAIYVHLVTQVATAEATAESRAVAFWQNHVSENWQAARDFLARRYPARWSNNPPQQ